VAVDQEPDQQARREDEEAVDEIRRLFARYRRIARHGQVSERDEPRDEEPPPAGRST
jgi:hypothetical protein